jgi:hypothetical protein
MESKLPGHCFLALTPEVSGQAAFEREGEMSEVRTGSERQSEGAVHRIKIRIKIRIGIGIRIGIERGYRYTLEKGARGANPARTLDFIVHFWGARVQTG